MKGREIHEERGYSTEKISHRPGYPNHLRRSHGISVKLIVANPASLKTLVAFQQTACWVFSWMFADETYLHDLSCSYPCMYTGNTIRKWGTPKIPMPKQSYHNLFMAEIAIGTPHFESLPNIRMCSSFSN